MKEYFRWHQSQLLVLNETNWSDTQNFTFLVMRCFQRDGVCGGAADRLKPIPLALLLAYTSKRLFFIQWDRPARLEHFLVPPKGGLNWTIPAWLINKLEYRKQAMIQSENPKFLKYANNTRSLVDMKFQSHSHGAPTFNDHRLPGELSYDRVFHDCWNVLFEPSPPIRQLIELNMKELGLTQNKYVSVHIRSVYTSNQAGNSRVVQNAVDCGSELMPGMPIYVASDSRTSTLHAVQYGIESGGSVVARMDTTEPLHLDRGSNFLDAKSKDWSGRDPADYYDTFVDLYLLAGGKCTTFNIGGYGRWANSLSDDNECAMSHQDRTCRWTDL
jgi:hypothetical protein